MPSTYVPARAVAGRPVGPRIPVSQRLRELAMLLALAAPTALAQEPAPAVYQADMSNANAGAGEAAADKFAVAGSFDNVSGTASGGTFSLTSGTTGTSTSLVADNMIFLNGFD